MVAGGVVRVAETDPGAGEVRTKLAAIPNPTSEESIQTPVPAAGKFWPACRRFSGGYRRKTGFVGVAGYHGKCARSIIGAFRRVPDLPHALNLSLTGADASNCCRC